VTDVVLIATIVAFFVAAALLVRVLDRMIAGSGEDADPGDAEPEQGQGVSGRDLGTGRAR
jgi:hypothetical protein